MKIFALIVVSVFSLYGEAVAQLNNLMWATLPVEKFEHMADEKAKEYEKEGQLKAIGRLYISLEKKRIIFKGLSQKNETSETPIYEFINEEFEIVKIIKVNDDNYTFEGVRDSVYKRAVVGTIQIERSGLAGKVISFTMSENGSVFQGVMNEYKILVSQKAKFIQNEFKSIDFGDYYAAMGDETVKY